MRNNFKIEFISVGAEQIPLPDNSVDTVISTWTLCSVQDLSKVLNEVRRVLKPEGTFRFVEHGASPNRFIRSLQHIATSTTKYFTGNCHYDRYFITDLEEAGLSISAIDHPKESMKPLIFNYQGVAVPKRE